MATRAKLERFHPSLMPFRACPCRPSTQKTLILASSSKFSLGLVLNGTKGVLRVRRSGISCCRRLIAAVTRTEAGNLDDGDTDEVRPAFLFCIYVYVAVDARVL